MELLVTVCLEWKHLADLACPCLHPRAGESPCGRCVPSCAAACRALHCSAALAGAHHQAGSGGARSRVLCGLGDGLGAGWGSLQPHCTCRNTGRLGVLPLWDVPQCAHGVRGSGVQSCPCTLRPCSCVCPVWLHQRHRGHPEPQQPRQQLWSCDPHRAGTGQPEWDGQGGCTQARRDGKLPTPSRFLPRAGQET